MTTPRNFRAHVALTAREAAPAMWSGAYVSVGEFFAVVGAADLAERFEPVPSNEWVRPGLAGAVAYRDPDAAAAGERFGFALAVYVEGDVTVYRFPRIEDAARAGRLWTAGLI